MMTAPLSRTGWLLAVCVSLTLCLVASGCAYRELIQRDHETVSKELAEVEKMGAKICAPMEFASAEANLDFVLDEWAERDYAKAKRHLDQARADVAKAWELSGNCIELTPTDTDGDGIADDRDACPTNPEDMDGWEDADGCPETDNDGDGFPDASDRCPNEPETVNGVEDQDGCPDSAVKYKKIEVTQKQIVLKEAIHFETGKSTILYDSFPILDEVVEALKAKPGIRIRVEGHTDSVGSREYNLRLSEERAASVVDYLSGHGIAASRMIAQGFGPDKPVAPNNTDRGRAKNRRVEIHIID